MSLQKQVILRLDCATDAEASAEKTTMERTDSAQGTTGPERLENMHPKPSDHRLKIVSVDEYKEEQPTTGRIIACTILLTVTVGVARGIKTQSEFDKQVNNYQQTFNNMRSSVVHRS